jgi:hypothetical protein
MRNIIKKGAVILLAIAIISGSFYPASKVNAIEAEDYYVLQTSVFHLWKYSSGSWQNGIEPGDTVKIDFNFPVPEGATDVWVAPYTISTDWNAPNWFSWSPDKDHYEKNYYDFASRVLSNMKISNGGSGSFHALLEPVAGTTYDLKDALSSETGKSRLRELIGNDAVNKILSSAPSDFSGNVEGYMYFQSYLVHYKIGEQVPETPYSEPQTGGPGGNYNVTNPPAYEGHKTTLYVYPGQDIVLSSLGVAVAEISPAAPANNHYKCNPSYKKIDTRGQVEIKFDGTTFTKSNIQVDQAGSIHLYQKVTAPNEPGTYPATFKVQKGGLALGTSQIDVVVTPKFATPPDPKPDHKAKDFPVNYAYGGENHTSETVNWIENYTATWQPNVVTHAVEHWRQVPDGKGGTMAQKYYTYYDCDHGHWELNPTVKSASFSLSGSVVKADEKHYTAENNGKKIKSGYGIIQNVTLNASSQSGASSFAEHLTYSSYPEFGYNSYFRKMDKISGKYELPKNPFSPSELRSHFTPIWFKDNTRYKPQLYSIVYTPAGKTVLSLYQDGVQVEGNLYDDYQAVQAVKKK